MLYRNLNWIILFGGNGREEIIHKLNYEGIKIIKIIYPDLQKNNFLASQDKLNYFSSKIENATIETLPKKLSGFEDSGIISIGFPFIITKEIFSKHKIALNVHPTLLPKYRGPTSGAYILINEEKYSGSTVHIIEEKPDSGPIIAQSKVEVSPFDTVLSLRRKVYQTEPALIVEAIDKLDNNFKLIPQDERESSNYPTKRKPVDSLIDPEISLKNLIPFIKACDPENYPAYFFYNGEKVCIKLWRPEKSENELDTI